MVSNVNQDIIALSLSHGHLPPEDFINVVKEISGSHWNIGSIERQQFYEETKNTYCVVSTSESRAFGCFILTKGVIKPDGTVWDVNK